MTVAGRKIQGGAAKPAPQNIEAEESLLGAMLLSKDAIADAIGICQSADFYKPSHRHIFDAVVGLWDRGVEADTVTVANELKRKNVLDEVGGSARLIALQVNTPAIRNAADYAEIVAHHALLRRGIGVTVDIAEAGYDLPLDADAWVDWAESKILDLQKTRRGETEVSVDESMDGVVAEFAEMAQNPGAITGTPTGFMDLDGILNGLQKSDLVLVGARPGMGKTAFAVNIARHVAVEEKLPVLIFSLEMKHSELTKRLLSAEGQIDSTKMQNGLWENGDVAKLSKARASLSGAPLYIDDSPNVTVMEIRTRARRAQAQHGLSLVVVDYLQLLGSRGRAENRQAEVSEISRALKILARGLDVPVIALSQLSRSLEMRADKRPMLPDLRESGSLEQDADVVLFIYRDEVYDPGSKDAGTAEIIVAKQRRGATGMLRLTFMESFTKFGNWSGR